DVGDAARAAVEPGQLLVRDETEPLDALAGGLDGAPAAGPGHEEPRPVQAGTLEGPHEPVEVLARLEGADGEDVVAVRRLSLRLERRADWSWDDTHLVIWDVEQDDQFASREFRDGDHPGGGPGHARQQRAAVGARPAVEGPRVPQHGEIVDRDDEWDSRSDGRALRGAVEHVGAVPPGPGRQRGYVPADVANGHERAAVARERVAAQLEIGLALEP